MLRTLAGGAAGTVAILLGGAGAFARRCRDIGRNCRSNQDCCSDFCDNDNNLSKCACPPGLGDCDGDVRLLRPGVGSGPSVVPPADGPIGHNQVTCRAMPAARR